MEPEKTRSGLPLLPTGETGPAGSDVRPAVLAAGRMAFLRRAPWSAQATSGSQRSTGAFWKPGISTRNVVPTPTSL